MKHSSSVVYVGLDVHRDSIAVAYAPQSPGSEVVALGSIGTRQCDIDRLLKQLQAKSRRELRVVYEAGPCRFWLQRYLEPWRGLLHRRPFADPQARRGPGEDGSTRCGAGGASAPRRRARCDPRAGPRGRGDPRPEPSARGCAARPKRDIRTQEAYGYGRGGQAATFVDTRMNLCVVTLDLAVIRACSAFVIALHSWLIGVERRAECVTRLLGFHMPMRFSYA